MPILSIIRPTHSLRLGLVHAVLTALLIIALCEVCFGATVAPANPLQPGLATTIVADRSDNIAPLRTSLPQRHDNSLILSEVRAHGSTTRVSKPLIPASDPRLKPLGW